MDKEKIITYDNHLNFTHRTWTTIDFLLLNLIFFFIYQQFIYVDIMILSIPHGQVKSSI